MPGIDIDEHGTITRYQQTQPEHNKLVHEAGRYTVDNFNQTFTPLRRHIIVKNFDDKNVRKERITIQERASAAHAFQTVSDRELWREAVMKPKSAARLGLGGGEGRGGPADAGGRGDAGPPRADVPEGSSKRYITDSQGNHIRRHTPHHYWHVVREIIYDEDGEQAFENTWQYYRPTDTAEPGFSQYAIGRIKSFQIVTGLIVKRLRQNLQNKY